MTPLSNDDLNQYLSEIGRKGGKSGRGKSKARTTSQARAAALAKWKKAREQSKGKTK